MKLANFRHRLGDLAVDALARATTQPAIAKRLYRDIIAERHPAPAIEFLAFCQTHRALGRGQLLQDLWVLFETGMMRGGYFVEFGAADGSVHSNTLCLETEMGWSGLLAEPNSDCERLLRSNRSADIETRCVWRSSGEFIDFLIADDPELSTVATVGVCDMHTAARQKSQRVRKVETISLNDMLAAHNAPPVIDYLSVDAEGSELAILSAFDFSQHHIRLVSVEHNYRADGVLLDQLMRRNGFERRFVQFSGCDYWYRQQS